MIELVRKSYAILGGGEAALAILVALIALVGALAGVVSSYVVSGRSVYINSITAERSKWIDKLRVNLAAYSALMAEQAFVLLQIKAAPGTVQADAAKLSDVLTRVNATASVIQLQLNPWGKIDENILKLVSSIVIRKSTEVELVQRADDLLIAHSQWLLKAEWEKVKFEAHGWWYRAFNFWRAGRRLRAYSKWAEDEGSLATVLADFAIEKAKPV